MNTRLRLALDAYEELHEAFQGDDDMLKEMRRTRLRALMSDLNTEEWEQYLINTRALSARWESEEKVQAKIREYEDKKTP